MLLLTMIGFLVPSCTQQVQSSTTEQSQESALKHSEKTVVLGKPAKAKLPQRIIEAEARGASHCDKVAELVALENGDRSASLGACLSLPEAVQRCLVTSYALEHSEECNQTIKAAPEALHAFKSAASKKGH